MLSAIPSPGPKASAAAAFSLKAERGDHSPDFSHPPPLQEQVRDAEVLFSLPKSGAPLPQCPPEQRDACSQREGRTQPGGVLRTEPGRKELGKQKRVQSGFLFCYGCYYLFIHVLFLLKRRWPNEREALPALRGGAGGNGALATHAGLPPQLPEVLSRISSMLAPSPSTLRLCLCHRGPTLTWASVSLSPIPTRFCGHKSQGWSLRGCPSSFSDSPLPTPHLVRPSPSQAPSLTTEPAPSPRQIGEQPSSHPLVKGHASLHQGQDLASALAFSQQQASDLGTLQVLNPAPNRQLASDLDWILTPCTWRQRQPSPSSEALSGTLGLDPAQEPAPMVGVASIPVCTVEEPQTQPPAPSPTPGFRAVKKVNAFGGDASNSLAGSGNMAAGTSRGDWLFLLHQTTAGLLHWQRVASYLS